MESWLIKTAVFILILSCGGQMTCGTYFVDISETGSRSDNDRTEEHIFNENFHKCNLKGNSCQYIALKKKTNEYEQVSSEDGLPQDIKGYKIWKKVQIEDRVYTSCKDAFNNGVTNDGQIKVSVNGILTNIYCNMSTDGGGWTVFLRRVDDTTSFNSTWAECTKGFGDLSGNFWLGLETIHQLTKHSSVTLRIDLMTDAGEHGFEKYAHFKIADGTQNYKLSFANSTGSLGDSLAGSDGQMFSTWDQDNDEDEGNCAVARGGPWWYRSCSNARLMSLYRSKSGGNVKKEMKWSTWKEIHGYVFAQMQLREDD